MFNRNFYPTPKHVYDLMNVDAFGKVVLEPSAGSGNIIDFLKSDGAKKVIACEKDSRLSIITQSKADRFVSYDFMDVRNEQISHIDLIVMNPPFSSAANHIIHAFEIAPEGCEIIALCNWSSIDKFPTGKYRELNARISNYGWKKNLGSVFSKYAERKTETDIALIKLFKPMVSSGSTKFDGFYMDEENHTENGIIEHNEIIEIVGNYKAAVRSVESVFKGLNSVRQYTNKFDVGTIGVSISNEGVVISKEAFTVQIQKKAWKDLFKRLDMDKYITSQVSEDINAFCEQHHNVPFTVKNIVKMFEILIGTQDQIFDRSLESAVDNFTKYTDCNRYGLPGWKTNSGHLLNKKIIVDNIVENNVFSNTPRMKLKYNKGSEMIDDLCKVICRLTYTDWNEIQSLWTYFSNNSVQRGKWMDWGFFEIRCFSKGTMHMKFKDPKTWELLNVRYAKIKGQVLPEGSFS